MRVLVVDDEPNVLLGLERVLVRMGHDVTTAGRGSEALSKALVGDYDLLICDLMLPDLNGTEVIRAIKAQAPELPVFVISALPKADYQQECFDAGASGFIEKPFRCEDIRNEVRLVEKHLAVMHVVLFDPDLLHQRRLSRKLAAAGCSVDCYSSVAEGLADLAQKETPKLLLIDAADPEVSQACSWAREKSSIAVVFGDIESVLEDKLLRAGAAMLLAKPLDAEALLAQARFLT